MIGAPLKYLENFSAYRVAEDMMTFRSDLYRHTSLIKVRMMSVCRDLSWASSMIMAEYPFRSGWTMNYLRSMPSVMYFIIVPSEVLS